MKRTIARMAAALLAAILFFTVDVKAISAQRAIVMDAQESILFVYLEL